MIFQPLELHPKHVYTGNDVTECGLLQWQYKLIKTAVCLKSPAPKT